MFVLFIGFFYTMPQMKGAGTTLAYIFPGLPYWAGVVLVGAVITLNVALGGMKGITLVQAFQYWAKMFAISVPIFVLMAVYGHYGKQLEMNGREIDRRFIDISTLEYPRWSEYTRFQLEVGRTLDAAFLVDVPKELSTGKYTQTVMRITEGLGQTTRTMYKNPSIHVHVLPAFTTSACQKTFITDQAILSRSGVERPPGPLTNRCFREARCSVSPQRKFMHTRRRSSWFLRTQRDRFGLPRGECPDVLCKTKADRCPLAEKAPARRNMDFNPFGPLTTKAAAKAAKAFCGTTNLTRCSTPTRSSSRWSAARRDCRTSWCASTPIPTASPPSAPPCG